MADVPPQHPPSSPSPSMDDDTTRFPSIASLVSPMPRPSVRPPAVDGSVACSTPPAGPPSSDSQWTAINRQASSSHPAPASINGSSTATDAPVVSSRASLALSSSESGPNPQSTHHHQTSNSTRSAPSLPCRRGSSLARPLQPRSAIAPRPIASRRQDSAVSELPDSQTSTTPQDPASFSSLDSKSVPTPFHPSPVGRNAAAHPKTPPSPASPAPSTNTEHDRRLASPPETLQTELNATHAHSYSKVNLPLHPTTCAYSPVHAKAIDSHTRASMPPPPNPVSATRVSAFPPHSPSNGSASASLSAAAAPMDRSRATEPDGRGTHHVGILLSIQTPGASDPTQAYAPDPVGNMPSYHPDSDASPRCIRCNAVWTYPPIDIDPRKHDPAPSKTLEELNTQTLGVTDLMNQYNKSKTESFAEWMRWHQTDLRHPDAKVPCMLVRNDPTECTSVHNSSNNNNNKRKSNAFRDDGHMSPKFRRLSCSSPPRNLQLTPPPDRPLSSPPPHPSGNHDVRYRYKTPAGNVEVGEHLAVILGVKGAPQPYLEPSPNDATSMWTLPDQRNKSVGREKGWSASPVK